MVVGLAASVGALITPSSQPAIASQFESVVADIKKTIDNDPPEGRVYDLVGHVQTSARLINSSKDLNNIKAQIAPTQREHETPSHAEQLASSVSLGDSNARQESQPTTTPKEADPIAESAAKDSERLLKRLIKLMGEFNKTVQPAERGYDLRHNARGGMIRMPDSSHDQDTHQAVLELLKRSNRAELKVLRLFQEAAAEMNQIITELQCDLNLPKTCTIQLYQLDDPKKHNEFCVLPDDVKTTSELIYHLVEDNLFECEGAVCIFLRKGGAHQLTPKGRLWELVDSDFNLRFPETPMENVEYEGGSLVLDWVVNDKGFAIALMDNGTEERGSVLELPQPNKMLNKGVQEYLRTCLAKDLSSYEIDHISDIRKPNDNNVANKPFHHNNFQHAKHRLVVKLRTRN